jgi:ADP-ribose pyrophosphatase YjhB (NUDIX family)
MSLPYLPEELYRTVYGEYVKRLCVDTIVIGPRDTASFVAVDGFEPIFRVDGPDGIALVKRDIPPQEGTYHLPGGTVYRGESLEEAARRLVQRELGIEIEILGKVGSMEFPDEESKLGGARLVIDSVSIVFVARAQTRELRGSKDGAHTGWFKHVPARGEQHPDHIPYLIKRGFLVA